MDRILLIGGPGTLSSSTIAELLNRGYQVTVFSTGEHFNELEPRVQTIRGNRDDISALQAAMNNLHPDVVLDFVLFTPDQAEKILHLVEGRLRQYIFVSTVDVYGYPLSHLPLREDDSWNPQTQSTYAESKRQCEQFFQAH